MGWREYHLAISLRLGLSVLLYLSRKKKKKKKECVVVSLPQKKKKKKKECVVLSSTKMFKRRNTTNCSINRTLRAAVTTTWLWLHFISQSRMGDEQSGKSCCDEPHAICLSPASVHPVFVPEWGSAPEYPFVSLLCQSPRWKKQTYNFHQFPFFSGSGHQQDHSLLLEPRWSRQSLFSAPSQQHNSFSPILLVGNYQCEQPMVLRQPRWPLSSDTMKLGELMKNYGIISYLLQCTCMSRYTRVYLLGHTHTDTTHTQPTKNVIN